MSNLNKIHETISIKPDLFVDLGKKDAEAVSGGSSLALAPQIKLTPQPGILPHHNSVHIKNTTHLPVYMDLDFGGKRYQDYRLKPGQSKSFSGIGSTAIIDYDESYCKSGIQFASRDLSAKSHYSFSLSHNGCDLVLG